MLAALRAEHNVLGACLYDIQGNIFAEYRRAGLGTEFKMPSLRNDGAYFERHSITLFRSVLMETDKTGSIAIVSDLSGTAPGCGNTPRSLSWSSSFPFLPPT